MGYLETSEGMTVTDAEIAREILANQAFLERLQFCLERLNAPGKNVRLLGKGCAVVEIGGDPDTYFDTDLWEPRPESRLSIESLFFQDSDRIAVLCADGDAPTRLLQIEEAIAFARQVLRPKIGAGWYKVPIGEE